MKIVTAYCAFISTKYSLQTLVYILRISLHGMFYFPNSNHVTPLGCFCEVLKFCMSICMHELGQNEAF